MKGTLWCEPSKMREISSPRGSQATSKRCGERDSTSKQLPGRCGFWGSPGNNFGQPNFSFCFQSAWPGLAVDEGSGWVSLFLPIERGSDARLGGVQFCGPPRFGPLGTFFGFFFLNLGHVAPNYPRKPPMRSSKGPSNLKIGGRFYPTPATPSRTWPPSHAWWGDLDRSCE